jgi:hypothetical protein
MSWGRLWMVPDFGSDDYHRRLRKLPQGAARAGKDVAQDAQIETMRRENQELKLYLAGLLQLLVRKGAIGQEDVEELVRLVERADQESRRADEPSSPDLEAIAQAARQART